MKFDLTLPLLTIAATSSFARSIDLNTRADSGITGLDNVSMECAAAMAKYSTCLSPLLSTSDVMNSLENVEDNCAIYQKKECQEVFKNTTSALAGCDAETVKGMTESFAIYTPIMDVLCVNDEYGHPCPVNVLILNYLGGNGASSSSFATSSTATKAETGNEKRQEVSATTKTEEPSTNSTSETKPDSKTPPPATSTSDSGVASTNQMPLIDMAKNDTLPSVLSENCYSKNCREATISLIELLKSQIQETDTNTFLDQQIAKMNSDSCVNSKNMNSTTTGKVNNESKSAASSKYIVYQGLAIFYAILLIAFLA